MAQKGAPHLNLVVRHTYINMDLSIPNKIFHYTSIGTLALILKNKSIRLSRLDTVDDISESISKDAVQYSKYLFVSCWTEKEEESIPFWNMYTPNMAGVRIRLKTPIFQTYSIQSDPDKALISNDAERESILPLEKMHGANYLVIPESPYKFYEVEYTDEDKLLNPLVYSTNPDGSHSIAFGSLGKYKNKEWSFQSEWRYRLIILPSAPPPSTSYSDERYLNEFLSNVGQAVNGKEPPFKHFFLNLNEEAFNSIEILLGPKHSSGDIALVEALINTYCPNATFSVSKLTGTIR